MKKLQLLSILLLIAGVAIFLYYREGSLPLNFRDESYKSFSIETGESVAGITKRLEKEDLIRNRIVFYLIIKQLGIDKKIQAGEYRLSPSMSAYKIATSLTRGSNDTWVTVQEGLRKEEVAQIIGSSLSIPPTEFSRLSQEGYLFPDTYSISKTASLEAVLNIFENTFEEKFQKAKQARTFDNGLTDHEIVILASLVEREGRSEKNRRIIASILYKRLKNNWPLQVDATVQYILGYQEREENWWKANLTKDDLVIDSPYNTYKYPGLPPEPIANPGSVSIEAAMDASENTPYWYYISSRDGAEMHYATTIEEHNENIRKYLR